MLPNTCLQIQIPLFLYTMAVDGYPKDRGIVPDYPVTPMIEALLAGRDPVMERAMLFLEKKLELDLPDRGNVGAGRSPAELACRKYAQGGT